jgi:hypothetical protein
MESCNTKKREGVLIDSKDMLGQKSKKIKVTSTILPTLSLLSFFWFKSESVNLLFTVMFLF